MIKALLKFAGTPVAIAALLLFGTERGRKITKKAAREVVRGGLMAGDKCKELAGQIKESGSNLIGQVKESTVSLIDEVKEEQQKA